MVFAAALVIPFRAAAAPAADQATLLRVFLIDGTSLVSYGEPARVSDRVIFSMPTSTTPNPPLHLVNLPIARVDWERTSRYAATARASHYVETQAETDYAALSNDVASTLNEVAMTAEPSQRLAIVQRARQTLADWPQTHFNYRAAEVRQLLGVQLTDPGPVQVTQRSHAWMLDGWCRHGRCGYSRSARGPRRGHAHGDRSGRRGQRAVLEELGVIDAGRQRGHPPEDPATAAVPIIVVTSQRLSSDDERRLGSDCPVLSKSGLTRDALRTAIRHAMSSADTATGSM
jgi:hypothetical protein